MIGADASLVFSLNGSVRYARMTKVVLYFSDHVFRFRISRNDHMSREGGFGGADRPYMDMMYVLDAFYFIDFGQDFSPVYAFRHSIDAHPYAFRQQIPSSDKDDSGNYDSYNRIDEVPSCIVYHYT